MPSALRSHIAIFRRIAALFRSPAWQALGLYVLARLVSLDVLVVVARQLRGARMMSGPAFRLWEPALLRWDAVYYASIAQFGYPSRLPTAADGEVLANTWAFFPAFPFAAGVLARVSGLSFVWSALAVNLAAGAIVAVCLAAMVRPFAGDQAAARAATLWAFLPTAFLLHVPYSEAVHLAFVAACLAAVVRRRMGLAALLLVGAALSRGAALPLAGAVVVRAAMSLGPAWSARGPIATRRARWLVPGAALVISALAPWLWMLVAWRVTGRIDAVTASQGAWGVRLDPSAMVLAWREVIAHDGIALLFNPSVIVLAIVVTMTGATLFESRIPLELKAYTFLAAGLVLLVAQPGAVAFGSIPRFAFGILTMPVMLALWLRRGWMVAIAAVAFTWLQYLWVLNVWSGRIGVAP